MRKILLLLLVMVFANGCVSKPPVEEENSLAPGFTYDDLEGESWSLERLKGEVVILYFWTANCPVCVNKIPELATLRTQLPGDARLLMLNAEDSREKVASLTGASGLTVLLNALDSFYAYKVAYVPTMVFVGREGQVEEIRVGALPNKEVLEIIDDIR